MGKLTELVGGGHPEALSKNAKALAVVLAEKIAPILDRQGVTPDQIGRVNKIRVGEHQALIKDNDGNAQIHDLGNASIVLSPSWDEGPDWPVVQPGDPVKIAPSRRGPDKGRPPGIKRAFLYPDSQIALRMMADGTLLPTHDYRAQHVATMIAHDARPDVSGDLGDFLDLPEWSLKFAQAPEFATTTNAALNVGVRFLAAQVAAAPHADHFLIQGNHDARLSKAIATNVAAAMRIKPGGFPERWPVLSIPNLLTLDALGIRYVTGYPAGEYEFAPGFVAFHGRTVNSKGSTAARVVNESQVCSVFGHVHRAEFHPRVIRAPGHTEGYRRIWAASPGTLARVDGAVPSYGSAEDEHGMPLPWRENWTQGVMIVDYAADGSWIGAPEIIEINKGVAHWRGNVYESDGDVPWRVDKLSDIR